MKWEDVFHRFSILIDGTPCSFFRKHIPRLHTGWWIFVLSFWIRFYSVLFGVYFADVVLKPLPDTLIIMTSPDTKKPSLCVSTWGPRGFAEIRGMREHGHDRAVGKGKAPPTPKQPPHEAEDMGTVHRPNQAAHQSTDDLLKGWKSTRRAS